MRILLIILMISSVGLGFVKSQIIHVPADQPTIQAGIDAAVNGDTVLVSEGLYLENIFFNGKAITIASHFILEGDTNYINSTIIDGSNAPLPDFGSTVSFLNNEDTASVLCGFTITGGSGTYFQADFQRIGGGIICYEAGAKIMNNRVINNVVYYDYYSRGGGIGCQSSTNDNWIILRDNIIAENSCFSQNSPAYGGGVYSGCNAVLEGNQIYDNECISLTDVWGGGLMLEQMGAATFTFRIVNNTLFQNNLVGDLLAGCGLAIIGGQALIQSNLISHNLASTSNSVAGGGMVIFNTTGEIQVLDNQIADHFLSAASTIGGGVEIVNCLDKVYINNNLIENNNLIGTYASWGGAIDLSNNFEVEISGNQVINNSLAGTSFSAGAGIWCEEALDRTVIRDNLVAYNTGAGVGFGGGIGIYTSNPVEVEIDRNIVKFNAMSNGGGLWTFNSFGTIISNNMFIENYASSKGGGLMLRHNPSGTDQIHGLNAQKGMVEYDNSISQTREEHPLVINNTFYANASEIYGGALYSDHEQGFPLIVNSVFWENNADTANEIYYTGPDSLWISNCNIDTSPQSGIIGNWKGMDNMHEDPLFTDTVCHIDGSSPCVDFGIDSLEFAGTWYYAPGFDFEGTPRPYGQGGYDIGADECDLFTVVPGPISGSDTGLWLEAWPNPFRYSTELSFTLEADGRVILEVLDLTGQRVGTIVSDHYSKGNQHITYRPGDLPSGIYILKVSSGGKTAIRKIIRR